MRPGRSVRKLVCIHIIIFAVALAYTALMLFSGIGCPIRYASGVPCPLCGISRAYISFLLLRVGDAFGFHPLFWLLPFSLFATFHRDAPFMRRVPRKATDIFVIASAVVFAAVWAIRLCTSSIP